MKRLLFGLVVVGLIAALLWQWTLPSKSKKRRRRRGGGAVAVEVKPVKRGTIVSKAHFIGSLIPRSQYTVAPQIGGRLSRLKVQVGDKVKQKQLLALVENNEVVQQVQQALAAVRVARAQLDEQNSRLTQAKLAYNRSHFLNKKSLVSQAEKEKTRSTYKVEAAKLRVMRAQLSQKRSLLKAARVRLSYTRIYGRWIPRPLSLAQTKALMEAKETLEPEPRNKSKKGKKPRRRKTKARKRRRRGKKTPKATRKTKKSKKQDDSFRVVGERFANEGALVQPNTPLLTLLDIRSVIAVIYVTEKDYIQLKLGQKAEARTYVYRKRRFHGKVIRIAPLLKESSRLARVEIEFPNLDLALKPGMFVRIEVELKKVKRATLIPREGLVRHKNSDGVFLFNKAKQEVQFVKVKTGIQTRKAVQILSPRIRGSVVTLGYHLLRNKSKVRVAGAKSKRSGKRSSRKRRGKRSRRRQQGGR